MAGDKIDDFYRDYYQQTFQKHGETPRGVDWKDTEAQSISFDYLVRAIRFHPKAAEPLSVLELGCGYGAFYAYLREKSLIDSIDYRGIDLVPDMITRAVELFPDAAHRFITGDFKEYQPDRKFDFIISSGVFNIRGDFSESEYEEYLFRSISMMFERADKGIACNMMTPAPTYKDPKLFYPDLNRLFAFIHNTLSRDFIVISSPPLWKISLGIFK